MTVKSIQTCAEEWKSLPWEKFQKNLFKLQHRIYQAAKRNDTNLIKKLQSLLIGSKCSKYLSVRQVTQIDENKNKAGVDGFSSLNARQCFLLVENLALMSKVKHRRLRCIPVSKFKGKEKPHGMPTILDRTMQCLIKYALEPVYQANTINCSDFSSQYWYTNFQTHLIENLQSNSNFPRIKILQLDIMNSFDNIDYEKLLFSIILPGTAKKFLRSTLKAGVLNNRKFDIEEPKHGGRICQLLCEIALNGVEKNVIESFKRNEIKQKTIRHLNNILFFLKPYESEDKLVIKLKEALATRGLNGQNIKTKLVFFKKGFNFLGLHFRLNNKYACYPSKDNIKSIKSEIKTVLKNSRYALKQRIEIVANIYKHWCKYHKFCDMRQVKSVLWFIRKWSYKFIRKKSNISAKHTANLTNSIFSKESHDLRFVH
jgi:RNA-directed DNA polymerase